MKGLRKENEMKSFFEEYGFILVSVIVIVALIGIINGTGEGDSGVAGSIGDSTNSIVDKFSTNAEAQVDLLIGE